MPPPPPAVAPAYRVTRPRTPLRILALHGFTQNAPFFRSRISGLRKSLKGFAEFTFLNGSLAAEGIPFEVDEATRGPPLAWWNWADAAGVTAAPGSTADGKYLGFDKSVRDVGDYVREHGPFDGILGFSQGATVAAYMMLQPVGERPPAIKFLVLISGFVPGDPQFAVRLFWRLAFAMSAIA